MVRVTGHQPTHCPIRHKSGIGRTTHTGVQIARLTRIVRFRASRLPIAETHGFTIQLSLTGQFDPT